MREASSMPTWTVPARPKIAPLLATLVPDAVTGSAEAAELHDVDVDELAGLLALVRRIGSTGSPILASVQLRIYLCYLLTTFCKMLASPSP
jgi:hypothetical protein